MSSDDLRVVPAECDAYEVSDAVPIPGMDTIDAGTNLLLTGPPMSGIERMALDILAAGSTTEEPGVIVTADEAAEQVLDRYRASAPTASTDHIRVVDCSGVTGRNSIDDTDAVKFVSSPGDLTGIGVAIAKCTRDLGAQTRCGLRLPVVSLSTMLRYADVDRVFNFLHVITGRISAAGYLGVCTLDPAQHDIRTVNTVTAPFDAVIEVRERDGRDELRVLGLDDVSRSWTAL